jgi:aspartyl-tRNA(Asn)/glutamyl-tRNA(Gln) amidotransferase subunit B
MRSPKEARKFLNKLRATLEYLSVFDSEKEGSLRVDANISIKGSERVEVKNITSYKGVEKALTFEITRQKNLLRRGQKVERETRHFLEARGVTQSSR